MTLAAYLLYASAASAGALLLSQWACTVEEEKIDRGRL